jgi:hypothetical protein
VADVEAAVAVADRVVAVAAEAAAATDPTLI